MPSAFESAGQQGEARAVLEAGVQQLAGQQTVTFTLYNRAVVSDDGSVFWVATAQSIPAIGSLHIATDRQQDEDQTIGATQAIFTSETEVSQFVTMAPGTMYIGTWVVDGVTLQVAFAARGSYYKTADLHHYSGYTIYPAMQSQIIASAADLPVGPIVSNSLPMWLAATTYGQGKKVSVYPSFLVPDNLTPPYVVAHVEPAETVNWGNLAVNFWPGTTLSGTGASPLHLLPSSQLTRDEVTLTLYGFTNQTATQYISTIIDNSIQGYGEVATYGFANAPVIRDEKRKQVEIAAIAQKKTIKMSVNYYQSTADAIARRLILQAGVSSVTVNGVVP